MTRPWHPSCLCAQSSYCVHSASEQGGVVGGSVAGLGRGVGNGHSRPREHVQVLAGHVFTL